MEEERVHCECVLSLNYQTWFGNAAGQTSNLDISSKDLDGACTAAGVHAEDVNRLLVLVLCHQE